MQSYESLQQSLAASSGVGRAREASTSGAHTREEALEAHRRLLALIDDGHGGCGGLAGEMP